MIPPDIWSLISTAVKANDARVQLLQTELSYDAKSSKRPAQILAGLDGSQLGFAETRHNIVQGVRLGVPDFQAQISNASDIVGGLVGQYSVSPIVETLKTEREQTNQQRQEARQRMDEALKQMETPPLPEEKIHWADLIAAAIAGARNPDAMERVSANYQEIVRQRRQEQLARWQQETAAKMTRAQLQYQAAASEVEQLAQRSDNLLALMVQLQSGDINFQRQAIMNLGWQLWSGKLDIEKFNVQLSQQVLMTTLPFMLENLASFSPEVFTDETRRQSLVKGLELVGFSPEFANSVIAYAQSSTESNEKRQQAAATFQGLSFMMQLAPFVSAETLVEHIHKMVDDGVLPQWFKGIDVATIKRLQQAEASRRNAELYLAISQAQGRPVKFNVRSLWPGDQQK